MKATWKPFKLRFQHIESDMQLKRQILESELRLAADAAAHKERQASALYRYEGALHRQKVAAEMEQNAKWRRKQKIIVESELPTRSVA